MVAIFDRVTYIQRSFVNFRCGKEIYMERKYTDAEYITPYITKDLCEIRCIVIE
jgi:hypothetical protein